VRSYLTPRSFRMNMTEYGTLKGHFMRVTKDQAAANREKILTVAARLFRERGLSGVGVDELTEAAGLSHGSLYSRFGSKDALAAAAVSRAFATTAAKVDGIERIEQYIDAYLSREHREDIGKGCTMAALGCEMARQSSAIRQAFTEGVKYRVARLRSLLTIGRPRDREMRALATLSTLVGAMVLARGVDDPEWSDRILTAAHASLKRQLSQPPGATPRLS
jgi:TetR/AcrR family transcriptional repressor of nem operon